MLKTSKYTSGPVQKRTRSVSIMPNIKGKMIGDVKFEFSTCIFVLLTAVIGLEIGLIIGFYDQVRMFLPPLGCLATCRRQVLAVPVFLSSIP